MTSEIQFEIFNRSTEKQYVSADLRMNINTLSRRTRFNKAATQAIGIEEESYVTFLRFKKQWFVCKTKSGDGYQAYFDKRTGSAINAMITARNIMSDFKIVKEQQDFFLLEQEHEYQGHKLFEIVPMP